MSVLCDSEVIPPLDAAAKNINAFGDGIQHCQKAMGHIGDHYCNGFRWSAKQAVDWASRRCPSTIIEAGQTVPVRCDREAGHWEAHSAVCGSSWGDDSAPDPVNRAIKVVARIQPIDVIESWGLGFNLGTVVKYIGRADLKGTPLDDLRKCRWYLSREIALRERGGE